MNFQLGKRNIKSFLKKLAGIHYRRALKAHAGKMHQGLWSEGKKNQAEKEIRAKLPRIRAEVARDEWQR